MSTKGGMWVVMLKVLSLWICYLYSWGTRFSLLGFGLAVRFLTKSWYSSSPSSEPSSCFLCLIMFIRFLFQLLAPLLLSLLSEPPSTESSLMFWNLSFPTLSSVPRFETVLDSFQPFSLNYIRFFFGIYCWFIYWVTVARPNALQRGLAIFFKGSCR